MGVDSKIEIWAKSWKSIQKLKFRQKDGNRLNIEILAKVGGIKTLKFEQKMRELIEILKFEQKCGNWFKYWNLRQGLGIDANIEMGIDSKIEIQAKR